MKTRDARALAQPQNLLDLPAFAAVTFAAIGQASLTLAHAIDSAAERRRAAASSLQRPRARLGPQDQLRNTHPGNDAWRIR